jgi:Flp pilus assembly protein CpaB
MGGVLLVSNASEASDVLVAARPIAVGHPVTPDDLTTARISGDGVRAIAAVNADSVVGQTATVPLVVGQLVNRDMLSAEPWPTSGHALVGLSLQPGQLPGDGLAPGDRVRILAVPGKDAGPTVPASAAQVLTDDASVYAVRQDQAAGGNTLVTVVVPEMQADALAALGSAGQVGLVEISQ